MEQSIRILIVEDSDLDVQLMQRELEKARLSFLLVRVQTLEEFTQQLELFLPDLILADYTLPTFSGDQALELARQFDADIPFVFVTGTIGEEIAIETLKKGATDYVMKENLKRLGPAVTRALHEAKERKARERTDLAFKDSMNRYREIVENAPDIIFTIDYRGYFLHVNLAGLQSSGYTIGELWKTKYLDLILPEHRERVKRHYMRQFLAKKAVTYIEYPILSKIGRVIWYAQQAVPAYDGETVVGFHVICRDITEHKKNIELEELKLSMFRSLPVAIIAINVEGSILVWNSAAESLLQWTEKETLGRSLIEIISPKGEKELILKKLKGSGQITLDVRRKDGNYQPVKIENSHFLDMNEKVIGYIGVWSYGAAQ